MKALTLRLFSVLLLLLFFFPMVQRELHALEHAADFHCDAPFEKHFHELEHSCDICDFNAPETLASASHSYSGFQILLSDLSSSPVSRLFLPVNISQVPARAPPFIS